MAIHKLCLELPRCHAAGPLLDLCEFGFADPLRRFFGEGSELSSSLKSLSCSACSATLEGDSSDSSSSEVSLLCDTSLSLGGGRAVAAGESLAAEVPAVADGFDLRGFGFVFC
jgi:hypothetical protein